MSKTDLFAGPMFHHDRDAIEAHLTLVVTALAVAGHLQDRTGMSIQKIVQALRPLQRVTVVVAGHPHVGADPLTNIARQILAATGAEWPTHLASIHRSAVGCGGRSGRSRVARLGALPR